MTSRLELFPGAAPSTSASTLVETQPEPFPYAYEINGRSAHPLQGWLQLSDLLHLVGMTDKYSFLIVDRTDGSGRWAQAIGHPHELVVELGLPQTPMRVTRSARNFAGMDAPLTLMTSQRTIVPAQSGDLFSAAEAAVLIRVWLEYAALGIDGTALRKPDDWH